MTRKISGFTYRHFGLVFLTLLGLCAFGFLPPLFPPEQAVAADRTVDDLKTAIQSDISPNLRMMALERLKAVGSTSALDALDAIARAGDLKVRLASCAQLGRMHTSGSKAKLKGLLEDANLAREVRMAAAAGIAEHWRDEGDIDYLEDKCDGDAALEAHLAVVKSRVYER